MADSEKAGEKGVGQGWEWARNMDGLAGVVGDQLNGVGKGADLCFGGLKEHGEAAGDEDFVEMVAC